jgi:cobalt-zinc-cadmium efflux system protein
VHDHDHALAGRKLGIALGLTLLILLVEVVAGWAAQSLALLSDAAHIVTDIFALGLAWIATRLTRMPSNERSTFGHQRSGILAALANSLLLLGLTIVIVVEAVMRLQNPTTVAGGLVMAAATLAILVNSGIALTLRGAGHHNVNVRAALLHVVSDIAASVGVLVAGLVELLWHVARADSIASLLIAGLIAYGAWQIVRETVTILMERAPSDVELDRLRRAMLDVPGVLDVHDLHVWSLSDGYRLLSAHVSVPDQSIGDAANLVSDIKAVLRNRFAIEHATIETECADCRQPQRRPISFPTA